MTEDQRAHVERLETENQRLKEVASAARDFYECLFEAVSLATLKHGESWQVQWEAGISKQYRKLGMALTALRVGPALDELHRKEEEGP